jgi:hypothetical protein
MKEKRHGKLNRERERGKRGGEKGRGGERREEGRGKERKRPADSETQRLIWALLASDCKAAKLLNNDSLVCTSACRPGSTQRQ